MPHPTHPSTWREQKLVDATFQIALTLTSPEHLEHFQKLGREGVAKWVAGQLEGVGFPTTPLGASWGVLPKNY